MFLAEGAQAVREALACNGIVHELFVTGLAAERNADLLETAVRAGVRVSSVTERAAASLSETVTPQGILAYCTLVDVPVTEALAGAPKLVAVLADIADPGNAGTVLRAADAAGADAVIFAGETVDVHNGKCVRASTGSLFHLPVARQSTVDEAIAACRVAGLRALGTSGSARKVVRPGEPWLAEPTAWVFGNEAHGLAPGTDVDEAVALPIFGGAESLNLATAAAVCLYATAFAQHG
jgi:TrmH family RNA methyltransferase